MKTVLLGVTTFNQLEYTQKFLDNLNLDIDGYKIDLFICDDASTDGTIDWLIHKADCQILLKEHGCGLTHSWNWLYEIFKLKRYDRLIIANNDILLSKTALTNLLRWSDTRPIVVPVTTIKGAGHGRKDQGLFDLPRGADEIAWSRQMVELCDKKKQCKEIKMFNGFFMVFNRDIIKHEFDSKGHDLFDPHNINVGNEDDLNDRIDFKAVVALDAYVFHYKGVSFKKDQSGRLIQTVTARNNLYFQRK